METRRQRSRYSLRASPEFSTWVELLRYRGQYQPEQTAFIFLRDGEQEADKLTYQALDQQARRIAGQLQAMGMSGERALLLHPPGLEFIAAFFGCLYAGVVSVPLYPPRDNHPISRLRAIAADAQATCLLTTASLVARIEALSAQSPEWARLRVVATDRLASDGAGAWWPPALSGDTLAFLQYTSGSTGTPKGVMVSHGNLLHNEHTIKQAFDHSESTMLVSWLPLFHDMGLIGNVLQALYVGVPCILMAPAAFLQQPLRWLQAISHYRATTSGAPNFAYDLCVSKITPEQRASLDLSSWTVAFNGAEPVRADTLDRFTTAFAPCGFRREAFYPCYGMAEATLFVSGGLPSDPPLLYQVDRVALEQNRVIAATDEQARILVSCGRTWLDQQLVIVDPESRSACPPGQVGEIWVAGPSVAQGYWNRPEQTQETFQAYLADGHAGPFLRTGDLGHLQDGELFITGRLKDLMIIRGRNHHPQDIELTVEQSHPALRAGCGAAFAIEIEGSEQLVVAQEVRRDQLRKLDTEDVIGAIRQAIAEQHELQVHTVLLLKTNSIPRTSSGKIQRHACRAGFLSGGLNILHRWQQGHTDSMLTDLAPEARPLERSRRAIQDWLVARMARLLKIAPEQLSVGEPLAHYGLDSLTAVTLSGDLEAWLGRRLSPTLAYDYPSIQALAAYLAQAPKVETVRPTASTEGNGDAIAIIGIGCRFPGASDPDTFWQRLREGFDAITEVPRSRWDIDAFYDARPATPGKMNTRWGGFLEHVDQFDPQFFGISPREAIHMDPQQRLLLEVSWEALEHAGQAPEQLAGSRTGVFMGMSSADYSHLQHTHGVEAHAYSGTGNALSIAANRLSYLLDLRGPSWTVDTACSSSLVAVHQACQSLRQGECDLALSGGVNLVLTPDLTISFSQAQMLAADGRCKTFDAAADGYVRGEGCGVVVLKRLSDARRAGDPILAVIQGSAVNQDGRSNGLTAPNGHAQRAVIRQALARAQVAPAQIGYLEAHGTGTALGDPIEVNALKDVLLEGRSPHSTCWLGSVKTHIGHLEAAAGIAGLIRVALSLQHEEIPPHLHLKRLNPHLALEGTPLAIATERQPWPRSQERRLAGVSAFGFGGTNAHVILEEAPAGVGQAHPVERPQHLLTLSARGEAALAELARRYGDFLTSPPGLALADVCFTANTGRNHFADRLAVVAESPEQLRQELTAFAAGKPSARWLRGQRQGHDRPGIAFLFTGQGSQYRGMGRQLYETQPSFRRTLDQCDEILRPYLAEPLLTVLYSEAEASALLDQTAYTQPALFALEYALAELWRSWGVIPSIVLGHSVGEYVAACVAGAFSLEQGLKLIAERARLMQTLSPPGEMATVFAGEAPVAAALEPYAPQVSLAALNGPENTVISGEPQALQAVLKRLRAAGIETKLLPVSHAFHSPLMEPVLEAFAQVASRTAFQPLRIPLISNLTGQRLAPGHRLEANHWRRHTREPVRFAQGLHTLFEQGYELGLELGPKPVLSSLAKHCQPPPGSTWLASLRQGKEDWQVLLSSLSTLYVQGVEVDWRGFDRDYIRHRLPLPTYPFQRKRYWITPGSLPRDDQPSAAPVTIPSTPSMTARRDSTLATLRSLVARLMQAEPTEVDIQVPFLEMGADSILLMEAIRAIESTFGCKITLRQLFEELTTLDALATYLDQQASAQAPELVQEPPAPTEPSQPATEDGRVEGLRLDEELKHIVTQQLQIMAQQLEVLRSRQGAPVPASAPAQPQANQQVTSVATRTAQATNTPPVAKEVAREVSGERMAIETRPSAPPPSLPPWGIAEIRARGLNPRQQQHLTALTERYTQHSPTSKRLTQTYRPVLADNRASAGFRFSTKEMLYPLVAERSQGARIWDIDGNEYLDITMGFGVNLCGHNPAFITEALAAQLQQGIALGPQTRLAGEVAQLICELTGMERASFANTGTEAVMTALRLARTATGRPKIALFAGAYHGHFDGTLGTAQAGDTAAVPLAPGVTPNMVADLLVLEYGNPQSLERIKAQAHELAAVLVEPVQSRRPDLQPKAFLKELRALTQDAGIALIFDEMITGFRIHPGGAQAWFGIQADIATYGKIVGGGLPIGVVAGQAAYLDSIDGGLWRYGDASYPQADTTFFAGTFCKHPLAMAAARAMLTHLKAQGPALQTQLNQRTARLAETLNGYFEQEAMPLRIAHFGSLFRFAYASNLDLLFYHLLEKQIYVWEGRNCFLSTAHTEEDIEYLIASVKESMQALRAGGFIPEGRDPPSDSPSAAAAPLSIAVETNLRPAAPAPDPDVNVRESVPLSEAQQQLWVLAKMGEEGSLAYHVSTSLRLQGPLRLTALHQALQQVVDRHEALRTMIDSEGEVQYILPALAIDLPLVDLSGGEEDEREARLTAWFEQQNRVPFDLSQGPLVRAHLLKLQAQSHLLVLTAHHIVVDGWSMGVMLTEWAQFYSAQCQGVSCRLEPPLPFRQHLQWQAQQRQGEAMVAHDAYWREQLAGPMPVLDLPTDRPRPALKTYHSRRQTIRLQEDTVRELKRLAQQKGCTLFMVLLASYTVLLHRLTGQDDLIVGIPAAGRSPEQGSGGLVGYCAHLLAIRSRLVGVPTFSEYLGLIRGVLLDAYEHQEYPFARLLRTLNLRTDTSHAPLVTATFNLDRPVALPPFLELEAGLFSQPIGFSGHDFNFNVIEHDEALWLQCDYNTDLFDATTIERLLGHFQTLLQGMVANPEQRVFKLPLLTDAERHQLLVAWNATASDYPRQVCIHDLFEIQASKTPDRVALGYADKRLTYRQLNEKANQLAWSLMERGLGRGSYVPVIMEPGLEVPVTFLAIMKLGAAFVPLDANGPSERISKIVGELNSGVVLVNSAVADGRRFAHEVLVVDAQALAGSAIAPEAQVHPEDPIYVIYTSGSTGVPKGAVNLHRGIVNRFSYMSKTFGCGDTDVILQTTHHTFDSAIWQLFWPLSQGARAVIPTPDIGLEPHNLIELIAKEKVTITDFVPSLLDIVVDSLEQSPDMRHKLGSLRRLLVGGEAIRPETISRLQALLPNIGITNAYGPTETSIGVIFYEIPNPLSGSIPIGRPIDNVCALILDENLNPSPIGVPGELYLGGACIGLGYLNNRAATAAAFIDNPFKKEVGYDRLYKTGDLARYRPDGNIEFLGRLDHQVKIRGLRIELGEIEIALRHHPKVQDTVVLAREDHPGMKRLVAYVVPRHGQVAGNDELRHFLKKNLPDYMVPSNFVVLETLPLTPSGKVNRALLPEPQKGNLDAGYVAPGTPTEEALARIWGEVLSRDRVGIHDNFFELGGDSILVIQVIARAHQAGLRLTPKQLFQHQTVAELATVAGTATALQAEQGLVTGPVPLTPIQQWFFAQPPRAPHHYNQSVLLEVSPQLQPEQLGRALYHLWVQHDALRLRFIPGPDGWRQVHAEREQPPAVTVVDLSHLAPTQQPQALAEAATQHQGSLNLTEGPLLRAVLFQLGDDRPARLLLIIHHLVVDGVSWRILLEDLRTAYQQLSRGEAVRLPPKTSAFKQWAERLQGYAPSQAHELDYWLATGRTLAPLPVDYAADPTANTVASTARVSVALSVEQTRALLQEVPAAYRTQINDVLLTALGQSLARWTGQRAVRIDLEGHGREPLFAELDLSRTVGWFTTVFPVVLEVRPSAAPGAALTAVKEQLRRIPQHGIGYGMLRYLSPDPALRAALQSLPQAEVSFNYLGQFDQLLADPPWLGWAQEGSGLEQSPLRRREYLLEIDGLVSEGELHLEWVYSTQFHRRGTVERVAQDFLETLEALIAHCQSSEAGGYTPSDFPLAGLNEQKLNKITALLGAA